MMLPPILNRVLYDVLAPSAALLFICAFLLVLRHLVGSPEASPQDFAAIPRMILAGLAVMVCMVALKRSET